MHYNEDFRHLTDPEREVCDRINRALHPFDGNYFKAAIMGRVLMAGLSLAQIVEEYHRLIHRPDPQPGAALHNSLLRLLLGRYETPSVAYLNPRYFKSWGDGREPERLLPTIDLDALARGDRIMSQKEASKGNEDTPWAPIQKKLLEMLGEQEYDPWFRNSRFFGEEGRWIYVKVPSQYHADWIKEHYGDQLQQTARALTGKQVEMIPDSEMDTPQDTNTKPKNGGILS